MRIAFFLSDYPVFSETFITNELLWLQKSNIKGKIWYEISRNEEKQPAVDKIKYPTQKIPKKIFSKKYSLKILKAHWYWLTKHPLRYLTTLIWLPLKIKWINPRSLIKAPYIALQIKKHNPDLIYNHDADNAYYFALICSKLTQIPLIVIFHTYHLFHQTKHLKTKIRESNSLIFQSQYSKKYAQNKLKNSKYDHKLHVISSTGVDTKFFQKNKNIISDKKIINLITISRLEKSKGFDFLIQAIHILKKQNLKVNCKIIGYGSQKEKLIKLRDSLNLTSEIDFLGKIPHNQQLIKYLSKAEIFILTSLIRKNGDRDMQPNVVKEAMSMELLTITSQLGGIKEVITDKENGFLLNNISPKDIADKIKKVWLLSIEKKKNVTQKARKTILQKYESKKINRELISLFSKYEK